MDHEYLEYTCYSDGTFTQTQKAWTKPRSYALAISRVETLFNDTIIPIPQHSNRSIKKQLGPFVCKICNKQYKYNCDLSRHIKYECQNRVKNFGCSLCSKRYYRRSHLNTHMQKHR